MELSKLSIGVLSTLFGIIITASTLLASFSYKTGVQNETIKNIKEQQIVIKTDLKQDITNLDKNKAEKEIVKLLFQKIGEINTKLDRLIEIKFKNSAKINKNVGEG